MAGMKPWATTTVPHTHEFDDPRMDIPRGECMGCDINHARWIAAVGVQKDDGTDYIVSAEKIVDYNETLRALADLAERFAMAMRDPAGLTNSTLEYGYNGDTFVETIGPCTLLEAESQVARLKRYWHPRNPDLKFDVMVRTKASDWTALL